MPYDFCGWATRNNLKCADGRIIRKNAFKVNDGRKVPLVWNHQHNSVGDVLGHAVLENRDEGVYAYCSFNNSKAGRDAKESVKHGDVEALSIWANNLQQNGPDVIHGVIREVSLVLAGANPGAFIESVLVHSAPIDDDDEEGIFYNNEVLEFFHSDEDDDDEDDDEGEDEMTLEEIFDSMTEEQQDAVSAIVSDAVEEALSEYFNEDDDEEDYDDDEDDYDDDDDEDDYDDDYDDEEDEMKHNIFDSDPDVMDGDYLSHADMEQIFETAKRVGSLRDAVNDILGDDGVLMHSIPTTGMTTSTGNQTYGFNDPEMLFPEFRNLNNPPEWISRNMDWVQDVLSKVHRTPFSRIKSTYANITEDEARAKGYIKGKQKKEEVFTLLKRTTDPQTIYKKQKLDRDDIIDITDFDVVAWIKAEMRVMLNEEIARAILIGDGRPADSEDKIQENHIRPIVSDVDLFNIKVAVTKDDDPSKTARNTIKAILRARKQYKGSGNPTLYTTEDVLTEMLLIEDNNGRRIYKTEAEVATAVRASKIVTVEVMENQKVTIGTAQKNLIGIMVNLSDYNVGATKGGEINMFDDFDIDYNQQKYLIETRISGALIKPFSAMTIYEDETEKPSDGGGDGDGGDDDDKEPVAPQSITGKSAKASL